MLSKLEWDSDHFKIPVYRVEIDSDEELSSLREAIGHLDASLLYVIVRSEASAVHEQLVKAGGFLADKRLVYHKYVEAGNEFNEGRLLQEYAETETKVLEELAIQAGKYSRFRRDPRLEKYFEGLYLEWLRNSLSRQIADTFYVYREKGEISGFITGSRKEQGAWIGLISVRADLQHRGIGSELLKEFEGHYLNQGVNNFFVITQRDNLKACSFYEANQYSVHEKEYIYHWWI